MMSVSRQVLAQKRVTMTMNKSSTQQVSSYNSKWTNATQSNCKHEVTQTAAWRALLQGPFDEFPTVTSVIAAQNVTEIGVHMPGYIMVEVDSDHMTRFAEFDAATTAIPTNPWTGRDGRGPPYLAVQSMYWGEQQQGFGSEMFTVLDLATELSTLGEGSFRKAYTIKGAKEVKERNGAPTASDPNIRDPSEVVVKFQIGFNFRKIQVKDLHPRLSGILHVPTGSVNEYMMVTKSKSLTAFADRGMIPKMHSLAVHVTKELRGSRQMVAGYQPIPGGDFQGREVHLHDVPTGRYTIEDFVVT
jgi:hypothetical protein